MPKKKLTRGEATEAVIEKMMEAFDLGNGVLYKINQKDVARVKRIARAALASASLFLDAADE